MKLIRLKYLLKPLILVLVIYALNPVLAQKKSKIKFEADKIEFDEGLGKKARRLLHNVVFKHKGVIMYCDSAYHYLDKNSLDAFGRVHIKDGDSLDLYSDFLHYDGDDQLFQCQKNVVLDNKSIHLTTDFLFYDRSKNLGYYLNGGVIENKDDHSILKSERGYYYTKIDEFYFKQDVTYDHPDFRIEADTLLYNAEIKKTTFLGPTYIHADSNLIYCESGFFNSFTKKSEYHQNAYILSETRDIRGDSIFYDTEANYGRIVGNANILDTTENILVKGQLAWIYQDRDSAVVTVETELQQFFDEDTLFLHADTFKIYEDKGKDAQFLEAFWHVRFFKSDLQGKCDSMVYSFSDSAIKMYFDPILWSGENQITGNYIQLNTANGQMHSMEIDKNSFIVSMVDFEKYNQIRGKQMTGYFKDNALDIIYVTGNGQSVYYALDDEDKFVGVNRGESSDLKIKLIDNAIDEIAYINDGNATFFPMGELTPLELSLKGFSWREYIRPKNREDIFVWIE